MNLGGTFNGVPDAGVVYGGGASFVVRYADGGKNVTLTARSNFEAWIGANFPALAGSDAMPGADPDGDGLSNLAEFAFKGDATKGTDRGLSAVGVADTNGNGGKELVLTVAVRAGAVFAGAPSLSATVDGVTYTIEGSADLSSFTAAVQERAPRTPEQSGLPDISGSGWEYHSFILTASEGLLGKGFLRASAAAS